MVSKGLKLGQKQAAQALHMLVSEGRVAAGEVHAVLKRREKLLRELRKSVGSIVHQCITADEGPRASLPCH